MATRGIPPRSSSTALTGTSSSSKGARATVIAGMIAAARGVMIAIREVVAAMMTVAGVMAGMMVAAVTVTVVMIAATAVMMIGIAAVTVTVVMMIAGGARMIVGRMIGRGTRNSTIRSRSDTDDAGGSGK